MPDEAQAAVEAVNMACFRLSRELDQLDFRVPEAAILARHLLRAAGRAVIDGAGPAADPAGWPATEEQLLLWLDAALRECGYRVIPVEGAGRPELPDPRSDWT